MILANGITWFIYGYAVRDDGVEFFQIAYAHYDANLLPVKIWS